MKTKSAGITDIKTWQQQDGRWHIDWKECNSGWSTGGGVGFMMEQEARNWLENVSSKERKRKP